MADARAGKLDLVLVTKIDRFSRSLSDFFNLWHTLEEQHVEFVSLGDNFDTSSATGRAMIKIVLVFAELERERTSERTKEKIAVRREQGLWFGGTVPLGYRTNPANKTTLEHDPNTAALARSIFRDYLKVGSARGLVNHLASNGTKRPARKSQRGKPIGGGYFTTQVLIDMLSNPAYIAKRTIDGGRGQPSTSIVQLPPLDPHPFRRMRNRRTAKTICPNTRCSPSTRSPSFCGWTERASTKPSTMVSSLLSACAVAFACRVLGC